GRAQQSRDAAVGRLGADGAQRQRGRRRPVRPAGRALARSRRAFRRAAQGLRRAARRAPDRVQRRSQPPRSCLKESIMQPHKVVSREEWLAARRELLAKEKELLKAKDAVRRQTRELPWVKIEKNYVFDGPNGRETLSDLFAGRSQLVV